MPANDYKIFAIIDIHNTQYKVTKDCLLVTEKLPYNIGDHVQFDKILLIGTDTYTSIGRPYVSSAKVFAEVEEQALTKKIIVYKKERRKRYQRNKWHRQEISVLRIMKIEHFPQKELNNYSILGSRKISENKNEVKIT